MVMLEFAVRGGRAPTVIFFDHGIPEDQPGLEVVKRTCARHGLTLLIPKITRERAPGESQEEFWRKERYQYLWNCGMPVLTGHHLGDVIETWLFSCINGTPSLIPYNTNNIYRPLLTTSKMELFEWATQYKVEWHDDELNNDLRFARCRIRHNIVPEVLQINPGLGKMLAKKLRARQNVQL